MPTRQEIAARVLGLRKQYGSHDKLAAALGKPVTRQAVLRHERNGRMQERMAERYARLTGTEIEEWLPDAEVIEVPLDMFLAVIRRLEEIAARLEHLDGDGQGPPRS